MADVKPQNLFGVAVQNVAHLSFSAGGGWFIRYHDGTARISMNGSLPQSFHRLAASYIQTAGFYSPQQTNLQYVFFGAGETVILQDSLGNQAWIALPEDLERILTAKHKEGWLLTRSTVLCPYDERFWFAAFARRASYLETADTYYAWNIQGSTWLNNVFIREIVEGGVPVSHLTYKAPVPTTTSNRARLPSSEGSSSQIPTAKSSSLLDALSIKFHARVMRDFFKEGKRYLKITKGDIVQITETRKDGWWLGSGISGEVGFLPGNHVVQVSRTQLFGELFRSIDVSSKGYLEGACCVKIFQKSGLPLNELGNVWAMADAVDTGRLSKSQFINTMRLISDKMTEKPFPWIIPMPSTEDTAPTAAPKTSSKANNLNSVNILNVLNVSTVNMTLNVVDSGFQNRPNSANPRLSTSKPIDEVQYSVSSNLSSLAILEKQQPKSTGPPLKRMSPTKDQVIKPNARNTVTESDAKCIAKNQVFVFNGKKAVTELDTRFPILQPYIQCNDRIILTELDTEVPTMGSNAILQPSVWCSSAKSSTLSRHSKTSAAELDAKNAIPELDSRDSKAAVYARSIIAELNAKISRVQLDTRTPPVEMDGRNRIYELDGTPDISFLSIKDKR